MKALRSVLSLALCACLLLAMGAAVLADKASPSPQKLAIDGAVVAAHPYHISGFNYFRLRELAALLKDTPAAFDVGYDASAASVSITTGKPYSGADEGEVAAGETEAEKSAQTVLIDGEKASLTAYSIGGYNYFQLRELGIAVGFDVNYDEESATMLVSTASGGGSQSDPQDEWRPDIEFSTTDYQGNTVTDAIFREQKLTLINYWAYWCPPCVGEMPDLQKISEEYGDNGLRILGVSDKEDKEDNIKTLAEIGVTYTCMDYVSEFDKYLDSGYVPTSVFVNQEGKVVGEVQVGSLEYSDWIKLIDSWLK